MPRRRVKGERETISYRDLQVLDFICRFGVVNRTAVQWWADTGRSVTLDRERRLREAGLIDVHPPIGRSGPLLAVTGRGLRLADRTELGAARVSVWSATHSVVCAQVGGWLEGPARGEQVLSEREMLAEERQLGERCYSVRRDYPERGWHRPDLYRFTLEDGRPREHVIEVELTAKAPERLAKILEAWQSHKYRNLRGLGNEETFVPAEQTPHAVIYLCAPKIVPFVERAVKKAGAGWCVDVQQLWFDHSPFAGPESQPSGGPGADRQPPEGVGAEPLDGRAAAATVAARSRRHPGSG
jgi:hypothetical protein